MNRPATLKEESWKAGCEALWDLKYHWWQLLSEKHLGALTPVQDHPLVCSFFWNGLWVLLERGLKIPAPVVLDGQSCILIPHGSPRNEKQITLLTGQSQFTHTLWGEQLFFLYFGFQVVALHSEVAAGKLIVNYLCFLQVLDWWCSLLGTLQYNLSNIYTKKFLEILPFFSSQYFSKDTSEVLKSTRFYDFDY